ncbi:hypothetical protein SEA_TRIBBY_25 [Arthrobacter phage Tribby]|uniref:Uncharacterized protein n=3 Tax=Mudcatvirus TaxID=1982088 RepID=A0A222ZJL5_9CAUD|nr:hypothetical protein PQB75_gp025 [Arthrobacter phage Tribby]YP_010666212.1 hypothetical protein PQB76_gp025 [Arthrobacter phage Cheesy]ASR80476.1 hypothetical protein SEA_TRIBBY_25 [Arthrobacter phage Tribby]ASR84605.1 hypothetical protein SEA_CHEESY_25 [Arthrobacter phage Cheesy]
MTMRFTIMKTRTTMVSLVKKTLQTFQDVYLKIAEPRNIRILLFLAYLIFIVIGVNGLAHPPRSYEQALGSLGLVSAMFSFVAFGALLGSIAVLPGIWWLERSGLLSMGIGVLFYMLILHERHASPFAMGIAFIALLVCAIRWLEIRRYQLAPREG